MAIDRLALPSPPSFRRWLGRVVVPVPPLEQRAILVAGRDLSGFGRNIQPTVDKNSRQPADANPRMLPAHSHQPDDIAGGKALHPLDSTGNRSDPSAPPRNQHARPLGLGSRDFGADRGLSVEFDRIDGGKGDRAAGSRVLGYGFHVADPAFDAGRRKPAGLPKTIYKRINVNTFLL